MRRAWLLGLGAIAVYGVAALITSRAGWLPLVPVYDGLAPPAPYRYVSPPPDLAGENEPPLRASGTLELTPDGSRARTVATADGQALVVFSDRAVPPREGEDEVEVRVTPLDPGRLPEPPGDLRVSGNAYRIEARYGASGDEVRLTGPATVVLRYAVHATVVQRLERDVWRSLETDAALASMQLFAQTDELGVFAASGVPETSRAWIAYAAAAAGVAAGAAGYLSGRRRTKRPRLRRRRPGRT